MTDYTKLIKALRECANWFEAVAASSQYAHDELMALHYGDKLRDAADDLEAADKRIDGLQKLVDINTKRCEALRKQLRESHESYEKHINELEAQAAFFDAEKMNYQENIEYRDERIKELEAQIPKEGEWQGIIIDGQYWAITCSNCHQVGFNARTPYCPNCGAKMKKGANDDKNRIS